jgi:Acetyltransferases
MSITLTEAHIDDIPNIVSAEREAFENPLQPIFRLYCPIVDSREESIASNAAEYQESIRNPDPDVENVWLKVITSDSSGNETIVGGAQWLFVFNETTSIDQHVETLASRHPAGGATLFASQAFRILSEAEARQKEGRRGEHAYATLATFFTLPEYRRRGIGHMFMEWGLKRADEKDLEAWIEAAPTAVPFYEAHGFVQMETTHLNPERPVSLSASDAAEWDATAKSLLPITAIVMCRPARSGAE